MPEPEVLAMLSHSQEFEQVKVSALTGIRCLYARYQQPCEKKEKGSRHKILIVAEFLSHRCFAH